MDKINFSDFRDKNIVSGLQRTLLLDQSQFEGLPSEVLLKSAKVSRMDSDNSSETLDNVKYVEFSGVDQGQIDAIDKVTGIPDALKKQMLANIPPVYFRVNIKGGKADNAKDNYDFIVANGLTTPEGILLKNITWGVTWQYATSYNDILGLVVPDLTGVKLVVASGKKN